MAADLQGKSIVYFKLNLDLVFKALIRAKREEKMMKTFQFICGEKNPRELFQG